MATKEDVMEVLKTVNDPELQMDVWTLGLIYEIEVKKESVKIIMTFTTPMCPYGPMLLDMIEDAIKTRFKEIADVKIDVTFEPPWEPSEELRMMFGV
ncbi:MAG: metal-sulfur cluster assembly factor [Candidatus Woesearchaeota archaeon]|nr:metal-sulfur cluster assembly factor [Candidatus Woesearchaeota archaeon]